MSAFVIVEIDVKDSAEYELYKAAAPSSIAAYGGRYVVRGGRAEELEGGWSPKRVVILEFDTVERAKEWWASPEYAPARAQRLSSADSRMIVVEGL